LFQAGAAWALRCSHIWIKSDRAMSEDGSDEQFPLGSFGSIKEFPASLLSRKFIGIGSWRCSLQ
jgi:hypothetical protein